VIIPFLERLDRDGVTRRIAEKRVLANQLKLSVAKRNCFRIGPTFAAIQPKR